MAQDLPGFPLPRFRITIASRWSCTGWHASTGSLTLDMLHAVDHPVASFDLGDDDAPRRRLVIGPDRAGNLLDVIGVDVRRRSGNGDPYDEVAAAIRSNAGRRHLMGTKKIYGT